MQDFHLDFQAVYLFLLRIQFRELSISGLQFHFARNEDGTNTLSDLAQRWAETAAPASDPEPAETADTGSLFSLRMETASLANLDLYITDSMPVTPFSTVVSLSAARVENITTLPEETGTSVLAMNFEAGATLQWQGEFSLNPLSSSGKITLADFSLAPVARYLQDTLPFGLTDGIFKAGLNYAIALDDQNPQVRLTDISLALENPVLTQNGASDPFFSAETINIPDGELVMPENRITVPEINLVGLNIAATRNNEGNLDLLDMLAAVSGSDSEQAAPPSSPSDTAMPWQISVDVLHVDDNELRFTDQMPQVPFATALSLNASLSQISNQPEAIFPLNAELVLQSGGLLSLMVGLLFCRHWTCKPLLMSIPWLWILYSHICLGVQL